MMKEWLIKVVKGENKPPLHPHIKREEKGKTKKRKEKTQVRLVSKLPPT